MDIDQDELTEALDKALKERGAVLVESKKLEEAIRKAVRDAYDRGYADGSFRWWKIWKWL